MMRQGTHEIREVLIGIAERIHPRIFLKRILRQGSLEMLQRHGAFETKLGGCPLKSGDGDRVIERIVQPAQMSGLRRDCQVRLDQPQVVTLARPEHHAVFAEPDRLTVTVDGGVAHSEKRHQAPAPEIRRLESHPSRP